SSPKRFRMERPFVVMVELMVTTLGPTLFTIGAKLVRSLISRFSGESSNLMRAGEFVPAEHSKTPPTRILQMTADRIQTQKPFFIIDQAKSLERCQSKLHPRGGNRNENFT